MDSRLKSVVMTALFGAGSAVVGFILMAVPNVEGMTAFLFVGGWVLGIRNGIVAALIGAMLYFGLNPMGMFPPLLLAQILGVVPVAVAGWFHHKYPRQGWVDKLQLGVIALLVTFWYDLLTNLAYPLAANYAFAGVIATLVAGIPFAAIHITGNFLIFVIVVPLLLNNLKKMKV